MKSSSFDLEELNCWNQNLDIGLDASLFYFLALDVQKGMDVSFLMPLESLHFNL